MQTMDYEPRENSKLRNGGYEMDDLGFRGTGQMDTNCNTEVGENDKPKSWTEVWYDFTQTTTFHGVNKITESTPFCFRR